MKKTSDLRFSEIVGAYCIRPVHHRMNRIAKHRRNIANWCNSGRMQYAPAKTQIID